MRRSDPVHPLALLTDLLPSTAEEQDPAAGTNIVDLIRRAGDALMRDLTCSANGDELNQRQLADFAHRGHGAALARQHDRAEA